MCSCGNTTTVWILAGIHHGNSGGDIHRSWPGLRYYTSYRCPQCIIEQHTFNLQDFVLIDLCTITLAF